MFYERFLHLCEDKKIAPSAAATQAGFNRGTVSVWKKKYEAGQDVNPDQEIIDKICAFFGCSEQWLRGISDREEKSPSKSGEGDHAIDYVDDELKEYLDELRTRPEMRMLFSTTKNATKAQIEAIVKFIEGLEKGK